MGIPPSLFLPLFYHVRRTRTTGDRGGNCRAGGTNSATHRLPTQHESPPPPAGGVLFPVWRTRTTGGSRGFAADGAARTLKAAHPESSKSWNSRFGCAGNPASHNAYPAKNSPPATAAEKLPTPRTAVRTESPPQAAPASPASHEALAPHIKPRKSKTPAKRGFYLFSCSTRGSDSGVVVGSAARFGRPVRAARISFRTATGMRAARRNVCTACRPRRLPARSGFALLL